MNIQDYIRILRKGYCEHSANEGQSVCICTECCTDLAIKLEKLIQLIQARRRLELIYGLNASLELISEELKKSGE